MPCEHRALLEKVNSIFVSFSSNPSRGSLYCQIAFLNPQVAPCLHGLGNFIDASKHQQQPHCREHTPINHPYRWADETARY